MHLRLERELEAEGLHILNLAGEVMVLGGGGEGATHDHSRASCSPVHVNSARGGITDKDSTTTTRCWHRVVIYAGSAETAFEVEAPRPGQATRRTETTTVINRVAKKRSEANGHEDPRPGIWITCSALATYACTDPWRNSPYKVNLCGSRYVDRTPVDCRRVEEARRGAVTALST